MSSLVNFSISNDPLGLLKKEVEILKEGIKDLYLNDHRVMYLGFSGGKDSSLTMSIFLEAIMELPKEKLQKEVHVLYSDTLMELVPVQVHTYKVLENIKKFAKENSLPIEVMHAKPAISETMWSMTIGRGMRPPSSDNRWCTMRLKTDVQENMLYEAFGTEDIETVAVVGSRKEESTDRAKRLTENTIEGHLKGHNVYDKSLVFAPIEDFSTTDVWTALRMSKIGREVLDADDLFLLYASTNGEGEECQTILGNAGESGKNPGCAKSGGRFGCWDCGLQHKKDAALVGMQTTHPYIRYLIRFRNWHTSIRDGNWHKYRDVYNHSNFTRLQYNEDNHRFGMGGPGGMNVKTRAVTLLRLLVTEAKIRETEPEIELISDEELAYIQQRWIYEGDYELTALKIAERYGRTIEIDKDDIEHIYYAKLLHETMDFGALKWYAGLTLNQISVFVYSLLSRLLSSTRIEK